jgi:hypothetical protein
MPKRMKAACLLLLTLCLKSFAFLGKACSGSSPVYLQRAIQSLVTVAGSVTTA